MTRILVITITLLTALVLIAGCAFVVGDEPADEGDQTEDGTDGTDETDGTDGTDGGDGTNGDGDSIEKVARIEPADFTYPDYSSGDLADVPENIGVAYTTYSDDPESPHFKHREKPLSSQYTSAQLDELEHAFKTAWHYYNSEFGDSPGTPQPAGDDGVQADGLVHIWSFNWLVQNLVGGDSGLGDPWDDGVTNTAMLACPLVTPDPENPETDGFPPQIFVVTGEVLLDWDRGVNETGAPLENIGNTQANIQIFENGLYEVTTEGERAVWKLWKDES